MDQFMQSKLEQILQENHMVSLITQLRGESEIMSNIQIGAVGLQQSEILL